MADTENPDPVARAEGRDTLTEAESKSLLADAGIAVPDGEVVANAGAAVAAAERVGFPVVAKVSAPGVTHKSEWADGAGVAVGLETPDAVREAAERILAAGDREGRDVDVLVEVGFDLDAGTEVIVGGVRKPAFGPTVLAGLGGVAAEVFEDTSHRLAPVSEREAREMFAELRAAELLRGYRGRPAADLDALAGVVRAVSDLLDARDEIREIDANPVLATPERAVALDALVVLE